MATDKPNLVMDGMYGMGDNLHQRGLLRQLMARYTVYLKSPWAAMYHDLIADGLRVVRSPTRLRTQMKNQIRPSEMALFSREPLPAGLRAHPSYNGTLIGQLPSHTILEAMCKMVGNGCTYEAADYRLPVPDAWKEPARALLAQNETGKPVLVYRPLLVRPEWHGGSQRNADPTAYAELFALIRDSFYVISVADLEPGNEWIIGPRLIADLELHKGELVFEHLAGLFSVADLVFTSSGFGAVLAPAVGTPAISIIGGYERASWHESGARFAPYLAIEPTTPCSCASSACRRPCVKTIDMASARAKIESFVTALGFSTNAETRPLSEMFTALDPPSAPVQAHLMRAMYPAQTGGLKA